MSKETYYCKLIPPRATFVQDMTEAERALMGEHARYMKLHFEGGKILIYGPVMASGGPFGMAVLEVESEAEARKLFDDDPSVRSGMNSFELYPMQVGAARGRGE